MMRALLCLLLALAGCSGEPTKKFDRALGWTMSRSKFRNYVFYRFGDAADTRFGGVCQSRPVFSLDGGDYPMLSERFSLTIDGRTWELSAFEGEHGRSLFVDDPRFVDVFRDAKQRISFRVGATWVRSFRPSPLLRTFIDECRVMRIKDPGAQGI
jgi:hypothetical protein